jgi:hypothetical protein
MEAVQTSKTSVNWYQSTLRYNPEDGHLHTHRREDLKSHPTIRRHCLAAPRTQPSPRVRSSHHKTHDLTAMNLLQLCFQVSAEPLYSAITLFKNDISSAETIYRPVRRPMAWRTRREQYWRKQQWHKSALRNSENLQTTIWLRPYSKQRL